MRQVLLKQLFMAVLFMGSCCLKAQCPEGDIYLTTQDEVVDFAAIYPNCEYVSSLLYIGSQYESISNINDLSPLQNLNTVENLTIKNTSLINLNGLTGLEYVNADLEISDNSLLKTISDVNSFRSTKTLLIKNNPLLENLTGLNQMTAVTFSLKIDNNPELQNLEGLQNLLVVGDNSTEGEFYIGSNSSLVNLDGLQALLNLYCKFIVYDNESLTSVNGLDNLMFIRNDITIEKNPLLEDLDGLSNVSTNGTFDEIKFTIKNNNLLNSIEGLQNIPLGNVEGVEVSNNPELAVCNQGNICAFLIVGGNAIIENNAPGCNTVEEVSALCEELSQCPKGTLNLFTQQDIDNFQLLYPDCTELNANLTLGWYGSSEPADISNLNGLGNLQTINGSLVINKTSLENMSGLENLESIIGNLDVSQNDYLLNLTGLENLNNVAHLTISWNSNITSAEGLENLTSITGGLNIGFNPNLESLNAFENLATLGSLEITYNDKITQLENFGSLEHLPNGLSISYNNSLQSLNGLNQLVSVGNQFYIQENPSLTNIEALSSLTTLNSWSQINNNPALESLEGLNQLTEVIGFLNIGGNSLQNLLPLGNLVHVKFDGAAGLGDLSITNENYLTSLKGLESLILLDGSLRISANPSLENLNGLENLEAIGSMLEVSNNENLISLEGLNNVSTIGHNMFPGLSIISNPLLTDLDPLSNIETLTLGGELNIVSNNSLSNINGLENIAPSTIGNLGIQMSGNLSACSLSNFCSYLSGGGNSMIFGNLTGCNSPQEILDVCALSIEEVIAEEIVLYPIPTIQVLNVKAMDSQIELVRIFDASGKEVVSVQVNHSQIDVSELSSGTYLVSVKTSKGIHNQKIIKK